MRAEHPRALLTRYPILSVCRMFLAAGEAKNRGATATLNLAKVPVACGVTMALWTSLIVGAPNQTYQLHLTLPSFDNTNFLASVGLRGGRVDRGDVGRLAQASTVRLFTVEAPLLAAHVARRGERTEGIVLDDAVDELTGIAVTLDALLYRLCSLHGLVSPVIQIVPDEHSCVVAHVWSLHFVVFVKWVHLLIVLCDL